MKERLGLFAAGLVAMSCIGVSCASAIEKEAEFVVDIDPQAMLVIPDQPVRLSLNPTQNGAFDIASFDVYASTNSKSGYTLIMETQKTQLESSTVDADTGIAPTIPAMSYVDGGITKDDFRESSGEGVLNRWGVSVDNETSFNPVGASSVIKRTASVANNEKTTINVAAKVNTDANFGSYSTTINFTLTPNVVNIPQGVSGGEITEPSGAEGGGYSPNTLARAYEIYYNNVLQKSVYVKDNSTPEGYHALAEGESTDGKNVYFAMQDMTPEICRSSKTIPDELQVIDLRDSKVYWIAKLADGKCWMTQNLDLNLSKNTTLTPADTDIKRNWTPILDTLNYDGKIVNSNYIYEFAYNNKYNYSGPYPFSFDVGDWYWIGNWDRDGVSTWYGSTTDYFIEGQVGSPAKFQFTTPFEGNGTHGHVGNYYSFAAATAMNDSNAYSSGKIDQSICPAHWTLPSYADYSSNPEGNDAYTLFQAYGASSNSDREITAAPLYFVRAGYTDSSFSSSGYNGYYWTNTVNSDSYAYYFYFSGSGTYAQGSTLYKYYRSSVRCLARE